MHTRLMSVYVCGHVLQKCLLVTDTQKEQLIDLQYILGVDEESESQLQQHFFVKPF